MFPFADQKALVQNSRAFADRFCDVRLRSYWIARYPLGGSMLDNEKCVSSDGSGSRSSGEASFQRAARLRSVTIVLGAAIALSVLGVASRAGAKPAADAAAGEQTYKSNCVVCHAADGTGSATGKALKAPDLHSDAVQKMTVAQMEAQVSDGKNNMPPFKNTLSKEQIEGVVAYVRDTFGKKK
jgi:cytochrome c6